MATVSLPRTNRFTLASTSAGPFLVGFRLFSATGLQVYINGLPTTAFTVAFNPIDGYDDNATITFTVPQTSGTVVQIDGDEVPARAADYVNPDPNLTQKLNADLGRLAAAVADLYTKLQRTVRALDPIDADAGVTSVDFGNIAQYAADVEAARLQVLAVEATLPQWQGAWVTARAYVFGDLVRQNGSTYFCVVNHTSGVFNTDLVAARWEMFAQKGDAGAGIGDVVAANAGSEYTAVQATFRANVGLTIGTAVQAFNQLLAAVAGLGANGFMARLSGSTAAARTMIGTANRISVTNGDGVAGNPTFDLMLASQVEAEGGADTNKVMTAQRVAQAIAAQVKGARVLLASKTASASSQLDFTEFNNAVYRYYLWVLENVKPTTDAVALRVRLSTNAGSTYDAGATDYGTTVMASFTGSAFIGRVDSAIQLTIDGDVGNAATEQGVSGEMLLMYAGDGASRTRLHFDGSYENTTDSTILVRAAGRRAIVQDTDALRFLFSSGTIASGTIRMYGIRE